MLANTLYLIIIALTLTGCGVSKGEIESSEVITEENYYKEWK